MGRGAGAVEGFVSGGFHGKDWFIERLGKLGRSMLRSYRFTLGQNVGAEKIACGFAAADQAGALAFD